MGPPFIDGGSKGADLIETIRLEGHRTAPASTSARPASGDEAAQWGFDATTRGGLQYQL